MAPYRIAFAERRTNKYSLAALAGALESSFEADQLEIVFAPAEELEALEGSGWLVALSFHTIDLPEVAWEVGRLRRTLGERATIVAGGPHASGEPEAVLELGAHYVVVGEGEVALPSLVRALGEGAALERVPGLVGPGVRGPRGTRVDLDAWPPFSPRYRKLAPIEISRGCPWACGFCQTPFFMGGRMRHRSVEQILRWARWLWDNDTRDLRFVSPDAFAYGSEDGRRPNLEALEALLEGAAAIFGREHVWLGSFPSEVRPENVSEETLALVLAHCANKSLVFGAQSGSDRLLSELHRGHGVAEVERATDLCLAHGLQPIVDFIFGFPGENDEDRALSRELVRRLTDRGATVHAHSFVPLAGSPLGTSRGVTVDAETRDLLGQLAGRRQQFGQWKKQELLNRKLARFRRRARARKAVAEAEG